MMILISILLLSIPEREVRGGVYFHCSTSFRLTHDNPQFNAGLNIFLQLQKNGSGLIDLTGKVDTAAGSFDVARIYHFNYEKQGDSVYHLADITTSLRSSETVDDTLMNNLFFSTTPKEGRYLRMTKMENSYVIDNLHSPIFICIVN
ncbi:hypothetical protein [Klebsiella sp. BIGb0407]|uniref:hypothetical protein n=1 Tax=Klebsiella sp. BIGb0407 TaxID=2940603 RepID=UPI002168E546|nr:hypothetical protein [Klebsiella sp. BIGb0407]MCS3430975.1 hypothetical protein [Klebsiella sp. BIGb0407]